MRLFAALGVFVAMSAVVVGAAWVAYSVGAAAVGGLVFALLWSATAIVTSRLVDGSHGGVAFWGILGLLLGPLACAWLAWKVAPRTVRIFGGHS